MLREPQNCIKQVNLSTLERLYVLVGVMGLEILAQKGEIASENRRLRSERKYSSESMVVVPNRCFDVLLQKEHLKSASYRIATISNQSLPYKSKYREKTFDTKKACGICQRVLRNTTPTTFSGETGWNCRINSASTRNTLPLCKSCKKSVLAFQMAISPFTLFYFNRYADFSL